MSVAASAAKAFFSVISCLGETPGPKDGYDSTIIDSAETADPIDTPIDDSDSPTDDSSIDDSSTDDSSTDDSGECERSVYRDADGDGFGDINRIYVIDCDDTPPEGYVELENATDCDDSLASMYPGAPETCYDGLVNDCDGDANTAAYECRVTGTYSANDIGVTLPGVEYTGGVQNLNLGRSVAGPGDINGDGIDDVAIGAPNEADPTKSGFAFYVSGSESLTGSTVSSSADYPSYESGFAGAETGKYLSSNPADLNADGYNDMLVGSASIDGGIATLIMGSDPFTGSQTATTTFIGDQNGHLAGTGLVFMDNTSVGVGASVAGVNGMLANGKYSIFLDPLSQSEFLMSDGDIQFYGENDGDNLGFTAVAGDLDGDGLDDIILSSRNADVNGNPDAGKAYIVRSSTLSSLSGEFEISTVADNQLNGTDTSDLFGIAMASGDDVDGDGNIDLVVTSPGTGNNEGAAWIFTSPLTDADPTDSAAKYLGAVNESAGVATAIVDFNGDSTGDVIVGTRENSNQGSALVFYGSSAFSNGATLTPELVITGKSTGDEFGGALANAGSPNNSGISGILIGASQNMTGGSASGEASLVLADINY